MAKVPNAVEKLPKIATAWVGCTNVTDRETTDGRATAYSERSLKTYHVRVKDHSRWRTMLQNNFDPFSLKEEKNYHLRGVARQKVGKALRRH